MALCSAAERAYLEGRAPLNAVEGFIRQIIGWREYVRGVYWLFMPDYAGRNFFAAERPLPAFFWTGETDMACLSTVIGETIANAYAHHIQRLMVIGNFAMLTGLDPKAVHRWYLEVYADAFEWVELPNVIGMSQFADGGLLGSKPYAASGAYIARMSDYCEGCRYDVRRKTGEGACPFNALYWDFLDRNADKLSGNRRLAQTYATWRRMTEDQRQDYRQSARAFLVKLDAGERI
jgi:deoxyribodipyrimidine photolyase-related protein